MNIQSFEEWSASRRPLAYMEAGITSQPVLNLLPVPEIPKPSLTVYGVMNRYNDGLWGFPTHAAAAEAASKVTIQVYPYGTQEHEDDDSGAGLAIKTKNIYTAEEYRKLAPVMRQIEETKRHNAEEEKRLKVWEDTKKEVDDKLLEDYQEYATALYTEQQIRNTRASYLEAANGDEAIAFNFLVRAFPACDPDALIAIVQKTEE